MRVYLDNAATTPLRPEVFEAMRPWLTSDFGNASTLYREGKRARVALDEARATIASLIGAKPTEVVFTSGGTEANNAVIAGATQAIRAQQGKERGGNHVVTSAFEHHAVLEPVQALKRNGYEVTLVKPHHDGFITTQDFAQALRPDTLFVSVMAAQNEIGTVQPIAALTALAHEQGILFHTDAVQALGKLPFDVKTLGIDAASFSAHKIGGPAGIGAFYLRRQTPFLATQLGGGQEGNRRSGTPNIAGAIGFAKALEVAEAVRDQEATRLVALRDHLAQGLLALDPRVTLTVPLATADVLDTASAPAPAPAPANSSALALAPGTTPAAPATASASASAGPDTPATHLPGMLSFLVAGYESETLIHKLDDAGFAVSGGSACSTGSLDPSHVLISLGLSRTESYSVLRLSLSHETTSDQAAAFLAAFAAIIHAR